MESFNQGFFEGMVVGATAILVGWLLTAWVTRYERTARRRRRKPKPAPIRARAHEHLYAWIPSLIVGFGRLLLRAQFTHLGHRLVMAGMRLHASFDTPTWRRLAAQILRRVRRYTRKPGIASPHNPAADRALAKPRATRKPRGGTA